MAAKKTTTARRTATADKTPARKTTTRRTKSAEAPETKTTTRKKATTAKKKTTTRRREPVAETADTGGMTVREAGRKGGLIGGRKGGETVKAERGVEFYQEIGRKGGQRVRELIEAGREAMAKEAKRSKR